MIEFYANEGNRIEIKPITIPWRKVFRLLFRLSLIGLIVGSCTQSVAWLGETSMGKTSKRYNPSYYHNNSYYDNRNYTPRSSTKYNEYQQPIEEEGCNNDYRY